MQSPLVSYFYPKQARDWCEEASASDSFFPQTVLQPVAWPCLTAPAAYSHSHSTLSTHPNFRVDSYASAIATLHCRPPCSHSHTPSPNPNGSPSPATPLPPPLCRPPAPPEAVVCPLPLLPPRPQPTQQWTHDDAAAALRTNDAPTSTG
jgi:hypothetical protein